MKGSLTDLMQQAQKMQADMQKAQEELARAEVRGESGAGLVSVVMNGRHDVVRVSIDDAVLSEAKEVLEDLLAAAVNDAVRKVEAHSREAMSGLASGLNLPPGFKDARPETKVFRYTGLGDLTFAHDGVTGVVFDDLGVVGDLLDLLARQQPQENVAVQGIVDVFAGHPGRLAGTGAG